MRGSGDLLQKVQCVTRPHASTVVVTTKHQGSVTFVVFSFACINVTLHKKSVSSWSAVVSIQSSFMWPGSAEGQTRPPERRPASTWMSGWKEGGDPFGSTSTFWQSVRRYLVGLAVTGVTLRNGRGSRGLVQVRRVVIQQQLIAQSVQLWNPKSYPQHSNRLQTLMSNSNTRLKVSKTSKRLRKHLDTTVVVGIVGDNFRPMHERMLNLQRVILKLFVLNHLYLHSAQTCSRPYR